MANAESAEQSSSGFLENYFARINEVREIEQLAENSLLPFGSRVNNTVDVSE